jgi:hypothetical protein
MTLENFIQSLINCNAEFYHRDCYNRVIARWEVEVRGATSYSTWYFNENSRLVKVEHDTISN